MIELEIPKEDYPRIKEFITNMIDFQINVRNDGPDKVLLYFFNAVGRAISQEELFDK
jgi:hypothetical protein